VVDRTYGPLRSAFGGPNGGAPREAGMETTETEQERREREERELRERTERRLRLLGDLRSLGRSGK